MLIFKNFFYAKITKVLAINRYLLINLFQDT